MKEDEMNVLSLLLPEGILEWFEVTRIEEEANDKAKDDLEKHLYPKVLHVYLDEILTEEASEKGLRPNGYTEVTTVNDYPVRNRKLMLHVRRRRYQDRTGKNVLLNRYKVSEDGTRMTAEYGIFFLERCWTGCQ